MAQNTRKRSSLTASLALHPNTRGPDCIRRPQRRQVASSASFPTIVETTAAEDVTDLEGELEAEEPDVDAVRMLNSVDDFAHLIEKMCGEVGY